MNTIQVITLDDEQQQTDIRDFDTIKEARAWVKTCALDRAYWDRRAESDGYAARNVETIQLHKNGECIDDWFPAFGQH